MEETEIVKSPSAQNTPKEASIRSQNVSINKGSSSPVRLSSKISSNASPVRHSQMVEEQARHSAAATPLIYLPQPSPTNNSVGSRQTSIKSNKSNKSPPANVMPVEEINSEMMNRTYKPPSLKLSPTNNETLNSNYRSPSPKHSPTKNSTELRNGSYKSPSLKMSPTKTNNALMNGSYKSLSPKHSPFKNNADMRKGSFKSPSQKLSPTQNNVEIVTNGHNTPKISSPEQKNDEQTPNMGNIDKIAKMSKQLTDEANALRSSIKSLSLDIARTKLELSGTEKEDVNFPYHLFLIEIVINKIHMKCECFDIDFNNLVISATFLGKPPIVLYDPSFGKIENVTKLNIGKSTLFAMTYDKICSIKEFLIVIQLTKQPPCSNCITNIGETRMDYTREFISLREELCAKWSEQKPKDDLHFTTAMPLSKNMYYLSCSDNDDHEPIGVIEATVRMSFLGKEITTAYCASSKPQPPSFLLKEDNGMTMYSCQKVEMDDQGKILLDEDVMTKKRPNDAYYNKYPSARSQSPTSQISSFSRRSFDKSGFYQDGMPKYDEIFTKMNVNELKIRVPKSTKVERMGKYDKIQELCSCESTPYNAGEQIQFELPTDQVYDKSRTHTSNFKYTYTGGEIAKKDNKDRKVINVTPTNCPVPVDMEKMVHPMKDVFILKIGKKLETKDKKTDLEIELVTPKAPSEKPIENNNISQQCDDSDVDKTKPKKKDKKGKSKKGGKNKKDKGKSKKGKKKK